MTSSRRRRAADRLFLVAVLLFALSVASSRHQGAVVAADETRSPSAAASLTVDDLSALRSATRHLMSATDDKRSWRKNRVRVWGKRTFSNSDNDDDVDGEKRSNWRKNTVRVWGKRRGSAAPADRRAWAGNTIRVWGKRLHTAHLPGYALDAAAASYSAAPKRSIGNHNGRRYAAGVPPMTDSNQRTSSKAPVTSDVESLDGDDREAGTLRRGKRWVVRRAVRTRPRWVAMGGPKRSWRTNVIRVWGKRAS